MARRQDVTIAFRASIVVDSRGRKVVTVDKFIRELLKVNHHFGPAQANEYIARYERKWKLMDEQDNGLNTYYLFNNY
ncbi:DNA polymerase V [Yersinia frederiksenii]|uniref:DNA polymerase V n=1 Tax=Yersinia frederiksenii TaxID=29484 RepID=UPI00119F6F75|nr:DNA polymerase V [Yersinia frederiksenii]